MLNLRYRNGTTEEMTTKDVRHLRRNINTIDPDLINLQKDRGLTTESCADIGMWFKREDVREALGPDPAVQEEIKVYGTIAAAPSPFTDDLHNAKDDDIPYDFPDEATELANELPPDTPMCFALAEQIGRAEAGSPTKTLAEKYGKGPTTIRDIIKLRTWKAA